MKLHPSAHSANTGRQLRGGLVWSGMTLLAAVALALAMVIASLALELGSEPTPPPPSPIQFSPPAGHPMAQ